MKQTPHVYRLITYECDNTWWYECQGCAKRFTSLWDFSQHVKEIERAAAPVDIEKAVDQAWEKNR